MPKELTCIKRISNRSHFIILTILPSLFNKINARFGYPPHRAWDSLDEAEAKAFADGLATFRNESLVNSLAFKLVKLSGAAFYLVI